jgi:hypothetical protein
MSLIVHIRIELARATLVAMSAVFLATPAIAQKAPKNPANDADKKICEKITVLGSRLAFKQVCMTRDQWAERRLDDRQAIDAAQRSPCVIQGVSAGGKPSC